LTTIPYLFAWNSVSTTNTIHLAVPSARRTASGENAVNGGLVDVVVLTPPFDDFPERTGI
jgi:hypothetical protein